MDEEHDEVRDEVLSAFSERLERLGERGDQLADGLDQQGADIDALAQAHATQSDALADLAARWDTLAALVAAMDHRMAELEARVGRVEAAHDLGQR